MDQHKLQRDSILFYYIDMFFFYFIQDTFSFRNYTSYYSAYFSSFASFFVFKIVY